MLSPVLLIFPQDFNEPIDYIEPQSVEKISALESSQLYVSSINLTGNFHDLVVVVGFSDKDHGYPTMQNSDLYPLIGAFPNGTLLKD